MRLNRLQRVLLLAWFAISVVLMDSIPTEARKKKEPPTKSIHGHVVDARKKSIAGAKVFIRNVNKKTTTTLITAAVSEQEIRQVVSEVIAELQVSNPKDVGRVMKTVMSKFAGKIVDGKQVNEQVRAQLGS